MPGDRVMNAMKPRVLLFASCLLFLGVGGPSYAAEEVRAPLAEAGRALADQDGNTRRKAAEVVGTYRESEAVRLLLQTYRAEGRDAYGVKAACAAALGATGLPEAGPALAEVLGDPDYWVRRQAAESLGKIPGPAADEALGRALADPDSRVRAQALVSAAGRPALDARVAGFVDDPDPRVAAAALEALAASEGTGATETLVTALESPQWQVRYRSAALLTSRGDERGVETLRRAVRSGPHPGAALREAGSAGEKAAPLLVELANDPSVAERQRVLDALEELDCPESTIFFSRLAADAGAPAEERLQAAMALYDRRERISADQIRGVAGLLGAEDPNLAAVALQVLLEKGGPEYLGRIAPLARDPNKVLRHFALANLVRHGGPEFEPVFVEALGDDNGANVRLALEALGRSGTPASLPAIRPLLEDRKLRRYAEAAVEAIESRR